MSAIGRKDMRLRLCVASVLSCSCLLVTTLFAQTSAPQDTAKAPVAAAAAPAANTTASTPAAPATPRPRFVPVLISVTDSSGNPVTGLTKEQLALTDSNHAVQPLQLYKDFPLHLGIILLSSPASFSQQQAAAIDLIQKVIRPGVDEAFVVTARGKKPWPSPRLDWKQDPAELVQIVKALDRDAGLPDAFNFDLKTDETPGTWSAGRLTTQYWGSGGLTVFDAVFAMMSSDPRPSRRVLVIFREPWAHSPGFGTRVNQGVEGQLARIIGAAQEMHISTFVIGLEDQRFNAITDNTIGKNYIALHESGITSSRTYDRELESTKIRAYNAGKTNVQRIAAETGGAALWSTKKNYSDAVRTIANQLAGQYIVTFVPAEIPGPAHSLKITSGSGAHVLAQTAFFVAPAK